MVRGVHGDFAPAGQPAIITVTDFEQTLMVMGTSSFQLAENTSRTLIVTFGTRPHGSSGGFTADSAQMRILVHAGTGVRTVTLHRLITGLAPGTYEVALLYRKEASNALLQNTGGTQVTALVLNG